MFLFEEETKEMDAREKLRETKYFLDQMERLDELGKEKEFNYNLEAFIFAWHSIIDNTILYDFAEKYSLGITRHDFMRDYHFRLVARVLDARGEGDALKFLNWLEGKLNDLKHRNSLLFEERTQIVHRERIKTRNRYKPTGKTRTYYVNFASFVSMFGPSPITTDSPLHTLEQTLPKHRGVEAVTEPEVKVMTYFQERPDESAFDICKHAYEDMERLVLDAEKEVWKKKV